MLYRGVPEDRATEILEISAVDSVEPYPRSSTRSALGAPPRILDPTAAVFEFERTLLSVLVMSKHETVNPFVELSPCWTCAPRTPP